MGIQATVRLLVAFLPPREPVSLFDPSGPILAPLGGVILLVGIASAVRVGLPEGVSPAEDQRE